MPEHLGFTVWMEVDGEKLEEYRVELDELSSTVTCWVPCQSGKEFRIGLRAPSPPRSHNYTLAFKMDGQRVEDIRKKRICMDDPSVEPRYYEGQFDCESGVVRPFQFAPLKHTDDNAYLGDSKDGLGDVVVSLYTFRALVVDRGGNGDRSAKPLKAAVVHERAKARLKSCIAFGQPRVSPEQSPAQDTEPRDPRLNTAYSGAERVGLFVFKYRDIGILVADGIAPPTALPPRAPSPVPESQRNGPKRSNARGVCRVASSSARTLDGVLGLPAAEECLGDGQDSEDEDLDDQLRELKARAAALEELCSLKSRIADLESKKRVRDEMDVRANPNGTKRAAKKVKKEPQPQQLFVPGVIIDLT